MNADGVMVAAAWAVDHPVAYAIITVFALTVIRVVAAGLMEEKMPDSLGLEVKYNPPPQINWVHRGQILEGPDGNRWEVTFVGHDFVTVERVRNLSYGELLTWKVVLP